MPGMRCTVAVCNNSFIKTKNAGLSITYHKFPKNKHQKKIWVQRCHRIGDWNPNSCHVCSIHFTPEDYKESPFSYKRRLKPTAIPTQYLMEAPEIPGLKICKRRKNKYSVKNTYNVKDEVISTEMLSSDTHNVKFDNVNSYYHTENERENQLNYENFIGEENEEVQAEMEEVKYSEIMAHSENNYFGTMEESYTNEATTQTEDDRILQTFNVLMQKNIQLENKVKQLEMKLMRLENFVQNSQIK